MRSIAFAAALLAAGCATGFGEGTGPGDDAGGDENADQGRPADAGPTRMDAGPLPCTEGNARTVDPVTGHCLIHFTTPLTWEGADAACKALGASAHLVALQTDSENELVKSMIGNQIAWIGLQDKVTEGTFVWVDTAPFVYANWNGGEPNNSGGNEDCALLRGDASGRWDDRPCVQMFTYVCER